MKNLARLTVDIEYGDACFDNIESGKCVSIVCNRDVVYNTFVFDNPFVYYNLSKVSRVVINLNYERLIDLPVSLFKWLINVDDSGKFTSEFTPTYTQIKLPVYMNELEVRDRYAYTAYLKSIL